MARFPVGEPGHNICVRHTTTVLVGLAVGAISLFLIRRLQQELQSRDPKSLSDRVQNQLEELEARFGALPA